LFKPNDQHKQSTMFNTVETLSPQAKKRLETTWAHAFYENFFCKLDESVFAPLYSKKYSRPNVPVNILVGFETLKIGLSLSDEAMYNSYLFNMQVRYALGLHDFEVGYFDLRTIYNFRNALITYEKKNSVSLLMVATKAVTKEQMDAFHIKGGPGCMAEQPAIGR